VSSLPRAGDQLVGELDTFHRGYARSVEQLAHLPAVVAYCENGNESVDSTLDVWPASTPDIRGIAIVAPSGVVTAATESTLLGKSLLFRRDVRDALGGKSVISGIHLAEPEVGRTPTISYLAPVRRDQKVVGIVAVFVRASALWDLAKASNGLAGPKSFRGRL